MNQWVFWEPAVDHLQGAVKVTPLNGVSTCLNTVLSSFLGPLNTYGPCSVDSFNNNQDKRITSMHFFQSN